MQGNHLGNPYKLEYCRHWTSQGVLVVKNPPTNTGDVREAGLIPESGRSLVEGMTTHSSILAWKIP